ncbi:MAG TPA: lamin tail domain-containing protein, partial [Phycisphaerae bacterium]|nr:lamin tail domain-containing protein [Phycisphaerae bacterium]
DRCPGRLFTALTANPEYRMLLADRIHEHLFNDGLLTGESVLQRWDLRADQVYDALPAESARWGDYRRDVDPGGGPTPIPVYERDVQWEAERDRLTNSYFPQRTGIVINQYRSAGLYPSVAAPTLNQHGGAVAPGFALTMSSGSATTYYTLDGTDPRREGGAISPDALVYAGAVTLNDNAHVMARARTGTGTWSALTETSFAVGDSPVRVTEIMFNPLVGALDGDEYEFVEVHNPSASSVFLGGMRLTGGVEFTFPDVSLPAGGWVLVVRNQAAFASRYPAAASMVVGAYSGNLSDGGETIRLDDAAGRAVLTIDYSDWYEVTDGAGWSLTLVDESVAVGELSLASSWRPSEYAGGSPAAADWDVTPGSVVINELLAHGEGPGDWIELHNTAAGSVDIGGWGLSDSDQDLLRYRFPAGTILSPGEHRVFSQVQFGFGLGEHGEAVYLTGADADGTLRGYRDGQEFGSSPNGATFGRYDTSAGTDFVLLESATPGAANAGPLVGSVVINEIMYHPADGGDEFIELHNISDEDVKLYDAAWPDHTWTLDGAVEYEFPAGVVIPAGGFVVLVGEGVAVAAFRAAHGVPADVAILGGYSGSLDNAGESVKLYAPGVPDAGTGFYSYVRIDRVRYDDEAPWPEEADGPGPSLARLIAPAYGNDPVNWLAGLAGGTPGRANVVEAGPALAANLGSSATLGGAYVAGSLPGGTVTPAWSVVSGPGAVTFADPASTATTATFRAAGAYVLRLTVSDGQYAAWDEVRVDVSGLMGDANGDGEVGIADLVALAQHYGDSNASWSDGDFNGDGTVGIADLAALADHYGTKVGQGAPAGGAARSEGFALPEPIPALPAGEISAPAAIAPIAPDIPPLLPAAGAPAPADAPASTRAAAEDDAEAPLADLDPIPDLLAEADPAWLA